MPLKYAWIVVGCVVCAWKFIVELELNEVFGCYDNYSLKLCFFLVKQMDELQVIKGFVNAAKRIKTVCKWDWNNAMLNSIVYANIDNVFSVHLPSYVLCYILIGNLHISDIVVG